MRKILIFFSPSQCYLAQHRLIPSPSHLFRICGALQPLKISDIQDLILFAALHDKERHLTLPKWCNQTEKNSIQKVVIVLVSGIGTAEYAKNQDCFTQCNALFDHVSLKRSLHPKYGFIKTVKLGTK